MLYDIIYHMLQIEKMLEPYLLLYYYKDLGTHVQHWWVAFVKGKNYDANDVPARVDSQGFRPGVS